MYIPKPFKIEDWQEITSFVERHSAIDLVTVGIDGTPLATLLPAIWKQENLSEGFFGNLVTHISRGNEQWKQIAQGQTALAIIHGAQAYISPSNYANKAIDHKVVPTWNYQSVHLTGTLEVSENADLLREIVSELSHFHEKDRFNPWSATDVEEEYMQAQLNGIVAITMRITKVEAKYKLSQNRPIEDQIRVAEDLSTSAKPEEREISIQMNRNLRQQ